MRLSLIVAAAVLLSASLVARADTTEYSVTINGFGSLDGTFTFDEPTLETSSFTVDESQFLSSNNADITSITVYPEGGDDIFGVGTVPDGIFQVLYSSGGPITSSFGEDLTSYSSFGNGDVTIDITDVAATPEPSSFLLLGTGLLGVAGVMRKRFA